MIAESEPVGMTTDELVKATGRNRRTIHGICANYQKNGLLQKSGRFGKYHLIRKATQVDEPVIAAILFEMALMERHFFTLGKVALASSTEFCDDAYSQRIFHESQKNHTSVKQKNASERFYMFEYTLRLGAIISYMLVQSMRYARPSQYISESKRIQLVTKWLEKAVNPQFLINSYEQLLRILEERSWKNQRSKDTKWPELMGGRFEEMENLYKKLFGHIYEEMENIWVNIPFEVAGYQANISESERIQLEQEDPDHIKCGGELLPQIHVHNNGQHVKKCSKCRRWIPVDESKP